MGAGGASVEGVWRTGPLTLSLSKDAVSPFAALQR